MGKYLQRQAKPSMWVDEKTWVALKKSISDSLKQYSKVTRESSWINLIKVADFGGIFQLCLRLFHALQLIGFKRARRENEAFQLPNNIINNNGKAFIP